SADNFAARDCCIGLAGVSGRFASQCASVPTGQMEDDITARFFWRPDIGGRIAAICFHSDRWHLDALGSGNSDDDNRLGLSSGRPETYGLMVIHDAGN